MLIIPFIHIITNEKNMNVHNIRILTIGGKYVWEESGWEESGWEESGREESGNINDILNQNNIYCTNIKIFDNIYLCKVDTKKTNINDMYKWNEIDINDNETFCWKDYIYFVGKNNECWLNLPKGEKIGDIDINKIILHLI